MIQSKVEPVPESLLQTNEDLSNLYSSGTKIFDGASENFHFMPPAYGGPHGNKYLSKDFLNRFGSPSSYHPVCCVIKKSL